MDRNIHAAVWSDSPPPHENRDRITHRKRTKQRVDRQEQPKEELRIKDFWTWGEILDRRGPWAKPGECSRPKVEQVEAARRAEAAGERSQRYEGTRLARKPGSQPQKCLGGGSQGVWLRQVGDLRKLPVLTGGLERPGRHRVMLWSAQFFQCGCIDRCGSYQPFVLAGLEWASSQVRLGRLGAQELQCACTVRSIQSHLHTPVLR